MGARDSGEAGMGVGSRAWLRHPASARYVSHRDKAGLGAHVASTISGRPEHSADGRRGMVLTMMVMAVRVITPAFFNAVC